jgi:antitoxin YefM
MRAMHATDARNNFAEVLDAATEDHEEVIITRSGGKEVAVVVSLRDWESMKETAFLLRTPASAVWPAKGIEQANASAQLRGDLGGDEVQVVEVGQVQDLEVEAGGARFLAEAADLVDNLGGGAGQAVGA